MYERPDPDSIPPHEGYGGGTPKPRKDRADSARIALPRPIVARMMIGAATFGSTWRARIRRWPQPSARAPSTYGLPTTATVALRITREAPAAPATPRARITFSRPGPKTAISERTMIRNGNDCQASTTRCATVS